MGAQLDLPPVEIRRPGKHPERVRARSLVCYWAVREMGLEGTMVGRRLGLTQSAVSRAVARGAAIVAAEQFEIPPKMRNRRNA